MLISFFFFFFKQKTAYEIGLGIPAEPLFRSRREITVRIDTLPIVCFHASKSWRLFYGSFLLPFKIRSEERFSRNAETDLVCRLLLEKKKNMRENKERIEQIADMTPRLYLSIIHA